MATWTEELSTFLSIFQWGGRSTWQALSLLQSELGSADDALSLQVP